jgi:hypothetical protein
MAARSEDHMQFMLHSEKVICNVPFAGVAQYAGCRSRTVHSLTGRRQRRITAMRRHARIGPADSGRVNQKVEP